jgi:hypothetical protein
MKAQVENKKLRTCFWLVNLLHMHKEGLKLSEINRKYMEEIDISQGVPFIKTTFQNYKNAIQDLLGIEISCDRHTMRYRIDYESNNELAKWMLNSFSVGRLVQEQQDVCDRILLEPTPAGMEYFCTAVESIRKRTSLLLKYQKFADEQPYTCRIDPYALKMDKGRWYIIARKDKKDHLQAFAFDRIKNLEIMEGEAFGLDIPFDPATYFSDSIGLYTTPLAETVKIRVYGNTYNYLHTKPLHHSQKERLITGSPTGDMNSCVWEFTLKVCPSIDLQAELLRWGSGVEVIAPQRLRDNICQELKAACRKYQ